MYFGFNKHLIRHRSRFFRLWFSQVHTFRYPGGIFNPHNFALTAVAKEKEIANAGVPHLKWIGVEGEYNAMKLCYVLIHLKCYLFLIVITNP
uniref:Uncharacterized protein n=1 Tax=Lactuca sativa TaxID=4236 RepID=A0A9R1WGW0_LACSA|nr:hypothetical protein LSAT_V11C200092970 [Lactuca sativa]